MEEKCADSSMGEWAAMPPPPPPYMFLMKFSWHSIQQIQEEGTANTVYQIGRLHHWRNLEEDRHNQNTSKNTTRQAININHREIKEGGRKENNNAFKFGSIFSFSFSLFSAFVQVYICVASFCFYLFSACVIIVELV
jgi:hypothetical protein